MYFQNSEFSSNVYEDDSACWIFSNEFAEFTAGDFKLEYPENVCTAKIEYPASPEAISPGSIYDNLPTVLTSPESNYESADMSSTHLQQQPPTNVLTNGYKMCDTPQFHSYYVPDDFSISSPNVYSATPSTMSPHSSISSLGSMSPIHPTGSAITMSHYPPHQPHQSSVRSPGYPIIGNHEKVPITPSGLSMKIQSMGFHHSFPVVRSVTDKALKLWMPLDTLDENRRNIIMQKAVEKDLDPNVVYTHLQMFPDDDWSPECPQELRELPVIDIELGGSALDAKSKHVKRPLNSFMIYRKAQTQRARLNAQRRGIKINHQTISSIVGLLWQTESGQVHEFFSDAAGVEKYLHSEEHPNYKFKPRKKSKVATHD